MVPVRQKYPPPTSFNARVGSEVMYTPPYSGAGELPRVYNRTLDPFVVLSAAATVTRELVLATSVILLPQRDVIHTAEQVASPYLISGGRVVLGVGVRWNREEMSTTGPIRRPVD